jgi:hypothetical protein
VRTLKPKSPQIRPAHIDTEEESSDEEQVELVAVVPVADSSDRTITAGSRSYLSESLCFTLKATIFTRNDL